MMPGDKVRPPAGNRGAEGDGINVKSILPPTADESGSLRALLERTAEEYGSPLSALTVLAKQNDPFRFDTPAGHRDGAWLADAAISLGLGDRAIHLRGLHYMVIGWKKPDGKPYINTDKDWLWLQSKAAAAARWLGYIPFDQIVDQRNDEPKIVPYVAPRPPQPWIYSDIDIEIPDAVDLQPRVYVAGFDAVQPYRIALIGEKSSLEPVLGPVANRFGADLYLPTGEASSTMVHTLAKSGLDGRKIVILYFHDCDPAGWQMPISFARKLQAIRVVRYPDIDFEVHRVALTPDQVRGYGLPSTPLKETEKRADKWLAAKGVEQTEIDALAALRPELLDQLARQAIAPFYDDGLARRVTDAREDWLAEAGAIVDAKIDADRRQALAEQLQAQLDAMREEIRQATEHIREQIHIDASEFDLPEIIVPDAEIDDYEQPAPLIDSEWDFAEQSQALIDSKAHLDGDDS
jgi:hypothetical protein